MERLTDKRRDLCISCELSIDDECDHLNHSEFCGNAKRYHRLASIEDILGDDYDLDRLRELVDADRDGRCVILPCKIDDEVYVNIMGKTLPSTVVSISQITETPTFKAMHGVQLCFIFKPDDVGKTVFLTREAAEAALKGEHDESV